MICKHHHKISHNHNHEQNAFGRLINGVVALKLQRSVVLSHIAKNIISIGNQDYRGQVIVSYLP